MYDMVCEVGLRWGSRREILVGRGRGGDPATACGSPQRDPPPRGLLDRPLPKNHRRTSPESDNIRIRLIANHVVHPAYSPRRPRLGSLQSIDARDSRLGPSDRRAVNVSRHSPRATRGDHHPEHGGKNQPAHASHEGCRRRTRLAVDQDALTLKQIYADAAGQGTVVWKMGARGREAATEMQSLFREVLPQAVRGWKPGRAALKKSNKG